MSAAIRFTDVLPSTPTTGWPGPIGFAVRKGALALFITTPGAALELIRLMVGLREPRAGTVEVLGVEPGRLERQASQRFRQRLGVGFDEPAGLVSNLSLRLNLVVPMLYSGLRDAGEANAAAAALLDSLDLRRWADTRPAALPPEIRREAVLARAIVRDPDILLLEEPLAGLGEARASEFLALCRERAGTVVMTTADREGVPHEHADLIVHLDTSGIEIRHEVGVV